MRRLINFLRRSWWRLFGDPRPVVAHNFSADIPEDAVITSIVVDIERP